MLAAAGGRIISKGRMATCTMLVLEGAAEARLDGPDSALLGTRQVEIPKP